MRITENRIISDFLLGVNRTRERLNQLNLQVSSQKRIQKVSDDPEGASAVMKYDGQLERIGQYSKNVDDGKGMLKVTADAIHTIANAVRSVKGIVAGASNTSDHTLVTQLADQIDHFLDMSVDLANTQFNRKYIFGGTSTTSAPFVSRINGNPPTQTIEYTGNTSSIQYPVGEGLQQPVNLDGQNVFSNGSATTRVTFGGSLDANAAVNSTFTMNRPLTDGLGVTHNILLSFTKTAPNTWNISAAMPPGATDAILSGGTATATFDPATGQLTGLSSVTPMTMTPAGTAPAPPFAIDLRSIGLTQSAGVSSTLSGTIPTNGVNFSGVLDPQASINATVNLSSRITDSLGVAHDIVFSFTKTAANTWQVGTASATGATITGGTGTGTATFDPATGALTGFAPAVALQLTGLTSGAPAMTVTLGGNGLTQTARVNGIGRNDSLFNTLIDIRDKLRSGISPTSADLDTVTSFEQKLMEKEATAGSMVQTLDLAQTHLKDQQSHLLTLRGAIQDVDLAEVGMKLKQEQVNLDAALSTGARIIPHSLLDFLK
jgi:flagellin-like hook-associated protein FlgL